MVSMSSLPNWLDTLSTGILLGISPMLGVVVIDLTSKMFIICLTHTDVGQWEALQLHAVSILRTASHVSVLQVMQLKRIITYKTITENFTGKWPN